MMFKYKLHMILSTLFMLLIVSGTAAFTIYKNVNRIDIPDVEYSKNWTYDDEYHWHRAIDASIKTVKDKAPHTFGEWFIEKNPTESDDGYYSRTCDVCGYTQHNHIPYESPFNFTENEDKTLNILSVKDKNRESLVIPDAINGVLVTSISENAFEGCSELKELTLGKNIKKIGTDAFLETSKLNKVNYTGNISNWCQIEFANEYSTPVKWSKTLTINNVSLIDIQLPKSVTSIGKYTFYGFDLIQSVHYNSTIEDWCNITFTHEYSNPLHSGATLYFNDIKVNKITIPNTITEIKPYAFYGCLYSELELPISVESIGTYAFANNTNLESIIFGTNTSDNQLKVINDYAFTKCNSLTILNLPDSLETLGKYSFYNCESLETINLNANLKEISEGAFAYCKSLSNISFPLSLEVIGKEAFRDCTSIPELLLPINVKRIDSYAFYNNLSLTTISFPSVIEEIGDYAFYSCSSLISLTLTNTNLTKINESTFGECSSITELTFGEKLTEIGKAAFSGCSSISELSIPDNVTSIGVNAFYNCSSLVKLELGKNLATIGDFAFFGCIRLLEIYNYTDTLTLTIGSEEHGYVAYYAIIIHVVTDDSITIKQGNYQFLYYNNKGYILDYYGEELKLTLPEYFTYGGNNIPIYGIYKNAFKDMPLKEITLPSSLEEIGDNAFANNTSLQKITFNEGLRIIGENAFIGDVMLTSITLPSSLEEIKNNAFKDCYRLLEVYNLSNLNIDYQSSSNGYIAYYAKIINYEASATSSIILEKQFIFYINGDVHLLLGYIGSDKNLVVPSTVTLSDGTVINGFDVYTKAFYECDLESLVLPEGLKQIGVSAFENGTLLTINLPKSLELVSDDAFKNTTITLVNYAGAIEDSNEIVFGNNNENLVNALWHYGIKTEEFEEAFSYDSEYHWHKSLDPNSQNVSGKEPHHITDWDIDEFPNEEGIYYETGHCDICDQTITRVHKHTYNDNYSYDEEKHWREACCIHDSLATDTGPHTFGEWKVIVPATIDADGYQERMCTICGYVERQTIYQLDHEHVYDLENWSYDQNFHWHQATCVHTYPTDNLRIDVEPHLIMHYIEPTARDDGKYYEIDYCTVCGYISNEVEHVHVTDNPQDYAYDALNHWNVPSCRNEGDSTIIHVSEKVNEHEHSLTTTTEDRNGIIFEITDCSICGYHNEVEVVDPNPENPSHDPANPYEDGNGGGGENPENP